MNVHLALHLQEMSGKMGPAGSQRIDGNLSPRGRDEVGKFESGRYRA